MKNNKVYLFYLVFLFFFWCQLQAQVPADSTRNAVLINTDFANFQGTVFGLIRAHPDYSTFAKLITVAGVQSLLSESAPLTIFAPNNEAFSRLPSAQLDSLLAQPEAAEMLIKQHIIMGLYNKQDISNSLKAGKNSWPNLNQQNLQLSVDVNRNLVLQDAAGIQASVSAFDLKTTNGIVHGVNKVLLP